MNKFYFLFLLVIVSSRFQSQDLHQLFSAEQKKPAEGYFSSLQYVADEVVVFMKNDIKKNSLVVDRYDSLMGKINTIEIVVNTQEIVKFFATKNEVLVFTNDHIEDKRVDKFSLHIYDKWGKNISVITLFEQASNGGYKNNFDVSFSPNGLYYAAICSEAYNEKLNESIQIKMFTNENIEIVNKTILTSLLSDKKRVSIPVINDNGTLYILKKYKIKLDNNYLIYAIDKNGLDTKTDLKLRIKKIADFLYSLDASGNLVIGGFYSSIGKYNFEGTFFAKYNQTLQNEYLKEYALPEQVITAFKAKKEIETFGLGLDNFRVSDCFHFNQDQLFLVAETY